MSVDDPVSMLLAIAHEFEPGYAIEGDVPRMRSQAIPRAAVA